MQRKSLHKPKQIIQKPHPPKNTPIFPRINTFRPNTKIPKTPTPFGVSKPGINIKG